MKNCLTLFFVLIFAISNLKIAAQSNFQKGYIISHSGDTIYGYIDYRQWDVNPYEINFRTDSLAEQVKYTPLEIKAFVVSEDHYWGGIFEIDKSPYVTHELTTENETIPDTDTVFLTILVDGTLSLYYMKDSDAKEHFFIRKNDAEFTELIYRRYLVLNADPGNKDKTSIVENNLYKGMLIYFTTEIPGLVDRINSARYNSSDLTKIVDEYNKKTGCLSDYCHINKIRNKWIKSLHVITGVTYSYYNFDNWISDELGTVVYSNPNPSFTWFAAGIGLNLMPPRKLQRFSIYNEILYHADRYTYDYQIEERPHLDYYYHKDYNAHYLKFSVLPRYQPKFKNFRPYINAGISLSIPVSGYYEGYKETHFWDQIRTENYSGLHPEVNFDLGIGLYYKKFNFDLRSHLFSQKFFLMISYRLMTSDNRFQLEF